MTPYPSHLQLPDGRLLPVTCATQILQALADLDEIEEDCPEADFEAERYQLDGALRGAYFEERRAKWDGDQGRLL